MRSGFFRRNAFLLTGFLSAVCVFSGVFYSRVLLRAEVVDCSRSFYFLVSEEENAAAAAQSVALDGGAGYVMRRFGNEYAVMACYFTEPAARAVQHTLSVREIPSRILEESGGTLYLTTNSEKRNAEKLKGCFHTLGDCVSLLYDLATAAETGGYTQQELKRILADVGGVLSRLSEENREGIFTGISACAATASAEIARIRRDIVYAKDLRYIQVWLSDQYLLLAEDFSV